MVCVFRTCYTVGSCAWILRFILFGNVHGFWLGCERPDMSVLSEPGCTVAEFCAKVLNHTCCVPVLCWICVGFLCFFICPLFVVIAAFICHMCMFVSWNPSQSVHFLRRSVFRIVTVFHSCFFILLLQLWLYFIHPYAHVLCSYFSCHPVCCSCFVLMFPPSIKS